jgi:hypothetical protein
MYSPKIEADQVRQLYQLKISFASIGVTKHMTEMVREALNRYIPETTQEIHDKAGIVLNPGEPRA